MVLKTRFKFRAKQGSCKQKKKLLWVNYSFNYLLARLKRCRHIFCNRFFCLWQRLSLANSGEILSKSDRCARNFLTSQKSSFLIPNARTKKQKLEVVCQKSVISGIGIDPISVRFCMTLQLKDLHPTYGRHNVQASSISRYACHLMTGQNSLSSTMSSQHINSMTSGKSFSICLSRSLQGIQIWGKKWPTCSILWLYRDIK